MLVSREWAARASAITAMTAAGTLGLGGVAFADIVENDISTVGNPAISAGGSTKIGYQIQVEGRGLDGEGGCNASAASPATVRLSVPAAVTADKTSLTFTSCATYQYVTFSAATAGDYPITVAGVTDDGPGTYTTGPANFTLEVSAPSNTAPTVSVTGVTNGATYEKSATPQPGCSVVDAEDTGESATPQISGGAYDDLGSHTVSCSYTDAGGLTGTAQATYTVVRDRDTTAPLVGYTLTPATPDGDNGWYTSDVSLAWTVTEAESAETLRTTGCVDQDITADQAATTYSCSATSEGGTTTESVTIKRDATGPVVSYDSVVSGTPGANGWYTSPVTVRFSATDALSGPATAMDTATSTGDGAAVTVGSPAFTDNAGNTTGAGAVTKTYKIDTAAPTTPTFIGGPGTSYYFGSDPAAPTCTATDATSGLASCVVTGGGTTVGTHTYTATATDHAGHTSTAKHTYTVLPWATKGYFAPVDMSGVWNSVKGGSTVPMKYEVFAGDTELTSTSAVKSFATKAVACPGSTAPVDEIETVLTGGTSLRYDATGGQFIQNWQTPKKPGTCAQATTTMQDGSTITANFMFR